MPKSPERIQFLTDVFTTAMEGGIGYWSQCLYYRWENEQRAVIRDVEAETDTDIFEYVIDLDVIAKGINLLSRGGMVNDHMTALIAANNRTNGDSDSFDAIDAGDADCIVQAGLFSEVRYG